MEGKRREVNPLTRKEHASNPEQSTSFSFIFTKLLEQLSHFSEQWLPVSGPCLLGGSVKTKVIKTTYKDKNSRTCDHGTAFDAQ